MKFSNGDRTFSSTQICPPRWSFVVTLNPMVTGIRYSELEIEYIGDHCSESATGTSNLFFILGIVDNTAANGSTTK